MLLALFALPIALQENWTPIGQNTNGVGMIEISPARLEAGLRYLKARVTSPGSPQSAIAEITVNCAAKTAAFTGELELYADGKLVESSAYPDEISRFRPYAADLITGPIAAQICPK